MCMCWSPRFPSTPIWVHRQCTRISKATDDCLNFDFVALSRQRFSVYQDLCYPPTINLVQTLTPRLRR